MPTGHIQQTSAPYLGKSGVDAKLVLKVSVNTGSARDGIIGARSTCQSCRANMQARLPSKGVEGAIRNPSMLRVNWRPESTGGMPVLSY